jgi:hypothetical protein
MKNLNDMKKIVFATLAAVLTTTCFAQGHFTVAFTGNGLDHMNINILTATLNGIALEAGDEIAAFDGTVCCGKVTLKQPINLSDMNTFATIAASRKEDGLANGFTVGDPISYKVWDLSKSEEITIVAAQYFDPATAQPTTASTFAANGSAFVKLAATINHAPLANAGTDQTVNAGTAVTLNGSASSDPDGNPLTYLWTVPAGITLSSNTVSKPNFTAPNVTADTPYTFSLVVSDGKLNSVADNIVVLVKKVVANVTVYPNPFTDGFQISGLVGTGTLTLTNTRGKVSFKKVVTGNEYVSVGNLPKGTYILKIVTSSATYTIKVIKQ